MSKEAVKGSAKPFKGEVTPPGDKSISHRSLMLGALASGKTVVSGFLNCEDTISTANAMRSMGAEIQVNGTDGVVEGNGLRGLKEPGDVIDAGNSGTTTRLLTGILGAQNFFSVLTGDKYLRARPMKRVTDPLRLMGARITGREGGNKLPLAIDGGGLKGISYRLPVASAQVKSALLLARAHEEPRREDAGLHGRRAPEKRRKHNDHAAGAGLYGKGDFCARRYFLCRVFHGCGADKSRLGSAH